MQISKFALKIHMWVNNARVHVKYGCYTWARISPMCDDDGSFGLLLHLTLAENYHFHQFKGQANGCHNTWGGSNKYSSFHDLSAYLDFSSLLTWNLLCFLREILDTKV